MDAKEARELIDQVCAELDAAPDRPTQAVGFLRRVIRPAGLGLLLGLGSAGALVGCGESGDLYGIPPRDVTPAGDLYGIMDVGPGNDMYGIPADITPAGDLYGVMDVAPGSDMYGVPDGSPAPDGGTQNG